jgi:hypothetical protein
VSHFFQPVPSRTMIDCKPRDRPLGDPDTLVCQLHAGLDNHHHFRRRRMREWIHVSRYS